MMQCVIGTSNDNNKNTRLILKCQTQDLENQMFLWICFSVGNVVGLRCVEEDFNSILFLHIAVDIMCCGCLEVLEKIVDFVGIQSILVLKVWMGNSFLLNH